MADYNRAKRVRYADGTCALHDNACHRWSSSQRKWVRFDDTVAHECPMLPWDSKLRPCALEEGFRKRPKYIRSTPDSNRYTVGMYDAPNTPWQVPPAPAPHTTRSPYTVPAPRWPEPFIVPTEPPTQPAHPAAERYKHNIPVRPQPNVFPPAPPPEAELSAEQKEHVETHYATTGNCAELSRMARLHCEKLQAQRRRP